MSSEKAQQSWRGAVEDMPRYMIVKKWEESLTYKTPSVRRRKKIPNTFRGILTAPMPNLAVNDVSFAGTDKQRSRCGRTGGVRYCPGIVPIEKVRTTVADRVNDACSGALSRHQISEMGSGYQSRQSLKMPAKGWDGAGPDWASPDSPTVRKRAGAAPQSQRW
jgi:hypothetical protein